MTHAYDEALRENARDTLGRMLDYSVHSLHMDVGNMLALFAASGASALFERGDIRTIAGMSGIELAYHVLGSCGISYERTPARRTRTLSGEYHLGSCIADIQYRLSLPFSEILKYFPFRDFLSEHADLRADYLSSLPLTISSEERTIGLLEFGNKFTIEAVEKYVKKMNEASGRNPGALLKDARIKNGLSQSALAKVADIPLRTLQQYEQGQKDIRKARSEYLVSLASVLNTEPSKLIPRLPSV